MSTADDAAASAAPDAPSGAPPGARGLAPRAFLRSWCMPSFRVNRKSQLLHRENSFGANAPRTTLQDGSPAEEGEEGSEEAECTLAARRDSTSAWLAFRSMELVGLPNLGNSCYMNAALQCLLSTPQLTAHFLSGEWRDELNRVNPLGTGGAVAEAFARLISDLWPSAAQPLARGMSREPRTRAEALFAFKRRLEQQRPELVGHHQHDAQELASFLLDGLHEDLNRCVRKEAVDDIECNAPEVSGSQPALPLSLGHLRAPPPRACSLAERSPSRAARGEGRARRQRGQRGAGRAAPLRASLRRQLLLRAALPPQPACRARPLPDSDRRPLVPPHLRGARHRSRLAPSILHSGPGPRAARGGGGC